MRTEDLRKLHLYQQLNRKRRIWNLRKIIARTKPLKVIIGAGPTTSPGWVHTDKELLDVTSPSDWQALFDLESIDALLAEHILEHLSDRECQIALAECYTYLKTGALFRVAVPDGYRRDPVYVAEASPPKDGHQVLFNVDSLTNVLERAGFTTTPLEYFDVQERFHCYPWNTEDGFIQRCAGYDRQKAFQRGKLYYTSIIVDARKN